MSNTCARLPLALTAPVTPAAREAIVRPKREKTRHNCDSWQRFLINIGQLWLLPPAPGGS